MHWRRRAEARRQAQTDQLLRALEVRLLSELELMLHLQEERLREALPLLLRDSLLEALHPLAGALKRQDRLLVARLDQTQGVLADLLGEVLGSLQPPASSQLALALETSIKQ